VKSTTGTGGDSSSLGPWLLRELVDAAEVVEAAEDVTAWGFPRTIEPDEFIYGAWFRMGRGVVFWFEAPHPQAPAAAIVHLAVAPRYRSRWPVKRWAVAVEIVAELMGATHLLAAFPEDCPQRDYALRLGWQKSDGPRLVRWLGGADGRQERRIPQSPLHEEGMERG